MSSLEVRAVRSDSSPARELVAAMVAEIVGFYGPLETRNAPSASPEELWAPHGTYLVLLRDGEPVAGGGLKRLEDDVAEIKRMYVVPGARGQGLARALLGALEDAARELGYARVRLDTGPRQPHARALYLSAGYAPVEDYNGNDVATFWGEKDLGPAAPPLPEDVAADPATS